MKVMLGCMAAFLIVTLSAWTISVAADPHVAPSAEGPAAAPPASTEAAPAPAHGEAATPHDAHAPAANQAVLPPPQTRWPAVMMLVVFGLFLSAAAIGWAASVLMPAEDVPVAHGHDESHGDAHGHGHSHGHARPRTPLDGHDHGHGGHH